MTRILRARPLLLDGLLAAAVALFLAAGAAVHHGSLGDRPGVFGLLLAAVGAAPLVVRRRYPIGVLAAVAVLVGAFSLADYRATLGRPDLLIAAYTVWARYPMRRAWPPSVFALAVFEVTLFLGDSSNPIGDTVIALLQGSATVLLGHSVYLRGLALHATVERADRAELAVVEERLRIARELHDVVSHHLSVISVQANLARYVFESEPVTARGALDTITGTTTEALDELRRLLSVLRPPHQEPGEYRPQPGLPDMPVLVSRVREAGLDIQMRITGSARTLPSGQQLCAFRVAQEALTNVLKHAPEASASLELDYRGDELRLTVSDTGGGPQSDGNPAGHGLIGMRERARMYGGKIEIGPREPAGFEVVLTLPYPGRTAGEPK